MNNKEQKNEDLGHLHPITIVNQKVVEIFSQIGFEIATGPELEKEYYNFDALNIPPNHPARDMWDTFWVKQKDKNEEEKMLLRTHTSPVQIRFMENNKPPIKIISPGKTYRYEATDASHEAQFSQIEGLVIDQKTNLADLKGTLKYFFDQFFGMESNIRFRPSYFPFVEPGVEFDFTCFLCKGKGCNLCKNTGWIEIGGAGMVHPQVLKNVGIDSDIFQGFAFGFGTERIAMLKYGVEDIRLFNKGDLRLVNQF